MSTSVRPKGVIKMISPYHPLLYYINQDQDIDIQKLKASLDAYGGVDQSDPCGSSLLMYAASAGNDTFVRTLVELGADVNQRDDDNDTPLLCASYPGHTSTVQLLLDCGADINAKDRNEMTSLMLAAWKNRIVCAQILLDRGASAGERCVEGRNARDYATGAYLPLLVRVRLVSLDKTGLLNLSAVQKRFSVTDQADREAILDLLERHQP